MYYKQEIFNSKLCPTKRQIAAMEDAVQHMSDQKQARFERFKKQVAQYWRLYPWLMVTTILLTFANCSHTKYVVPNDTITSTDTYKIKVERDSVYVHDSVFIKEYTKADTIYRDRWVTHFKDRWLTQKDTILQHDTTIVYQQVEVTKEVKKVPSFYKWCTGIFFFFLIVFVILIIFKIWRKFRG